MNKGSRILITPFLVIVVVAGLSMGALAAEPLSSVSVQWGPFSDQVTVGVESELNAKTSLLLVGGKNLFSLGLRMKPDKMDGVFLTGYAGRDWEDSSWMAAVTGGYEVPLSKTFGLRGEVGGSYNFDAEKFDAIFGVGLAYRF